MCSVSLLSRARRLTHPSTMAVIDLFQTLWSGYRLLRQVNLVVHLLTRGVVTRD